MARLYDWLNDPQRNEKIFNSRLNDEFDNVDSSITTIETDITELSDAISAIGGPPVAPASFSASKSGDQTGIADATFTQLTFPTEVYDVGSHFASSAWTPPAGKVLLIANCYIYPVGGTAAISSVSIWKNGNAFKLSLTKGGGDGGTGTSIIAIDVANGSDVYTAYGYQDVSGGSVTVDGTGYSYFMGHWLSA